VAANLERFVDGRVEARVLLVDFDDLGVAGASPGARELVARGVAA
jgi:hypothetical protein